jgi:erythritol kinase
MIIGIDAGTSVVKAVAFSDDGENLAVEARRTELYSPKPDESEQDLEEIVAAVGEVVRAVAERSGETPDAIGLTGQGDGLWLFDERGYSVRPAISWLDARANPIVEEWMSSGVFEAVFRRNGNIIFPGSHAPLLAALERSEPESLTQATTAGYCKDGILQRFTGERATDASDASLPFLDVRTRHYDEEIIKLCGLERWEHLLAPVDPAPGPMRTLNAEGAELTGLPEGTPIHSGPFDLPASAIGAGVDEPGEGLIIIGTTLACEVLTDRVETDGEVGGMTLCALEPDRWLRAMPAMVGTASLDWVLSLIGAEHKDIEEFLEESGPGARSVTALPFFSASGERAPFVAPMARGQLAGLSLGASRADVVSAICESVGYAARHCLEAAGLEGEVAICGGGVESAAWRQILADVLQKPLRIARRPEVGARGAAVAALIASERDFDYGEWTRPEGYVEPRAEMAELYEEGFAYYLDSVESARELWGRRPRTKAPQ